MNAGYSLRNWSKERERGTKKRTNTTCEMYRELGLRKGGRSRKKGVTKRKKGKPIYNCVMSGRGFRKPNGATGKKQKSTTWLYGGIFRAPQLGKKKRKTRSNNLNAEEMGVLDKAMIFWGKQCFGDGGKKQWQRVARIIRGGARKQKKNQIES